MSAGAIKFRSKDGDILIPFNYNNKVLDLIEEYKKKANINTEQIDQIIYTFSGKVLDPKKLEATITAGQIKLKNNSIIQVTQTRSMVGGIIDSSMI